MVFRGYRGFDVSWVKLERSMYSMSSLILTSRVSSITSMMVECS